MTKYAFRDKERKEKILALEATIKDKGIRHYCPNHSCDAHMTIRNIGDDAFFSSTKTKPHIDNCDYSASKSKHKYDEESFDFNAFLTNLTKTSHSSKTSPVKESDDKTKEQTISPIKKLKTFYWIMHGMSIDSKYNGQTIGKMLLDERSIEKYHSKGIFGNKVIECKSYCYHRDQKEIISKVGFYTLVLKFQNEQLYDDIVNRIYTNAPQDKFSGLLILIAGNWSKISNQFNCFETTIFSKKQVAIL